MTTSVTSPARTRMSRHEFLRGLHRRLRPRTYLETGIQEGRSLALSKAPSIGIDPAFAVVAEVCTDVQLARTTSDEFFARKDPLAYLPTKTLDLAFIDGMHLSEYALRDYLAVERFSSPTTVVMFDDMLPRSAVEAARRRLTRSWTGDVYKAAQALREFRPDLVVLEVDTQPTGVAIVLLPDASRDGVLPEYDDWLDVATAEDPQDVPAEVLTRSRAADARAVLDSPGWATLAELRTRGAAADEVRAAVERHFRRFAG